MVITYLAQLPDRATIWSTVGTTVPRMPIESIDRYVPPTQTDESAPFLVGRFGVETIDVAEKYYDSRGKNPPYIALKNCGDDLGAAIDFTLAWGPLTRNQRLPLEFVNIDRPLPWVGDGKDFCVDVKGWIHLKRRFDLLISLAETDTEQSRRDMSEFFRNEGWHRYDAGSLRLGLDWRKPEGGTRKGNELPVPQLVAGSLYLAFVAQVWMDVGVKGRRLLRCANPNCGKYFSTEKRNKEYCDLPCGQAVARRKWWNETGADRRKKAKLTSLQIGAEVAVPAGASERRPPETTGDTDEGGAARSITKCSS